MIFLFASLPSDAKVSASLVENCARLAAEWQLYVMHTRSLRKVFLSIKGVYYQAEVLDQIVTWLVPYQFTQNVGTSRHRSSRSVLNIIYPLPLQIPSDVDIRVMLTFLELYQTLLGFVFFKLYTDTGLVYPPPLDVKKDEGGAGVGAFTLQEALRSTNVSSITKSASAEADVKRISSKDVRQTIKAINATNSTDVDAEMPDIDPTPAEPEEEFVPQPSTSNPQEAVSLPTLQSLSSIPQSTTTKLFAPYTFWLSRETSRPIFEFLVRCLGGRIGWPATSGSGSPFDESDDSITHVIIDRPIVTKEGETDAERERRQGRKYVQPQWVVDCINAGKILLEEPYAQGKTLPPHLSPFEGRADAYDPIAGLQTDDVAMVEDEEEDESEVEDDGQPEDEGEDTATREQAALKAISAAEDLVALRAAELEAEAAGVDPAVFEKEVKKAKKKVKVVGTEKEADGEDDMNKMLMSNKQRKLYERMKFGERKRAGEVSSTFPDYADCSHSPCHFSAKYYRRKGVPLKRRKNDLVRHHRLVFGTSLQLQLQWYSVA